MKVDVLTKECPGTWKGEAWLVRAEDGRTFVVSGVNAYYSGWEVLVFPCAIAGEGAEPEVDYCEVAGGRGITHDQAIEELESYLTRADEEEC